MPFSVLSHSRFLTRQAKIVGELAKWSRENGMLLPGTVQKTSKPGKHRPGSPEILMDWAYPSSMFRSTAACESP